MWWDHGLCRIDPFWWGGTPSLYRVTYLCAQSVQSYLPLCPVCTKLPTFVSSLYRVTYLCAQSVQSYLPLCPVCTELPTFVPSLYRVTYLFGPVCTELPTFAPSLNFLWWDHGPCRTGPFWWGGTPSLYRVTYLCVQSIQSYLPLRLL